MRQSLIKSCYLIGSNRGAMFENLAYRPSSHISEFGDCIAYCMIVKQKYRKSSHRKSKDTCMFQTDASINRVNQAIELLRVHRYMNVQQQVMALT